MDRRNYVRSSAWRTEGVVENDDSDEVEDGGVDSDDDDTAIRIYGAEESSQAS